MGRCDCFTEIPLDLLCGALVVAEETGHLYKPFGVAVMKHASSIDEADLRFTGQQTSSTIFPEPDSLVSKRDHRPSGPGRIVP
jgi:hypothetical protein